MVGQNINIADPPPAVSIINTLIYFFGKFFFLMRCSRFRRNVLDQSTLKISILKWDQTGQFDRLDCESASGAMNHKHVYEQMDRPIRPETENQFYIFKMTCLNFFKNMRIEEFEPRSSSIDRGISTTLPHVYV